MNKNISTVLLCILCCAVGFNISNKALSNDDNFKIAYVDVNKLVANSDTIINAKNVRDRETKELFKWYDSANLAIQNQNDNNEKEELIKKYEAQLTQKKKLIKDNYSAELKKADSQIEKVITAKAHELGYDYVFKKDAMLFGAVDITPEVLPLIK